MLIEFKVTNFRSINATQTLSMIQGIGNEHQQRNTFGSGLGLLSWPRLLRSCVIYGPNAGGKSNVIRAMEFMRNFVLTSQSLQEGQPVDVVPFNLKEQNKAQPSEFEVIFINNEIRYQYGFATTSTQVIREWLLAYPEGKPQRWFERNLDSKNGRTKWYFGRKFSRSGGPLLELWRDATRRNGLFLSTAIQLNNEQLKPLFSWFQHKLSVMLPAYETNAQVSIEQCATDEGRQRVMEFMNSADIGILAIEFKKVPFSLDIFPPGIPKDLAEPLLKKYSGREISQVRFLHKSSDSDEVIAFDISEESAGTQKLFAFAGPLLNVLADGSTMFVDELDTSLHPLIVRFLINLIHNPEINKNNAQLIFTTHDTSILDTEIFRRDQVWFVEKDKESATQLYPLSDFSPRKGEALEKGYLKGRYGALPFVGEPKF